MFMMSKLQDPYHFVYFETIADRYEASAFQAIFVVAFGFFRIGENLATSRSSNTAKLNSTFRRSVPGEDCVLNLRFSKRIKPENGSLSSGCKIRSMTVLCTTIQTPVAHKFT